MTESPFTRRKLGPVASAVFVIAFFILWHLSLLTVCHEWSTLRWSEPGLGFQLAHSALVMVAMASLAVVPFVFRSAIVHVLCWSIIGASVLLRTVDWVVYRQSGLHTNLLVMHHANGEGLQLVVGFIPRWQLALPVAALLVTVLLSRLSRQTTARPWKLLFGGGVLIISLWICTWFARKPQTEHALTGPEWTLFRSLRGSLFDARCLAVPKCAERLNTLDENVRRKLVRYGLHVNPRSWVPLTQEFVYRQPIPFAKTAAYTNRPNVIVIFVESMSSYFVGAYRPERQHSYTPKLDALAKEVTRVENLYNATTPTSPSMVAGLCSFYPPLDLSTSFFGKMHCLSDALQPYGYRSYFIRGIQKEYGNIGPFLESQGFEVLDRMAIDKELKEPPKSWGFSDHQLLEYLRRFLEKQPANQPFFVGLTTVDTHIPYNMTQAPKIVPDTEGPIWNVVHSTDDALGEFWRWFKSSRFRDNTIVVLAGDHAAYPTSEYKLIRKRDFPDRYYDEIAFFLHAPGYQLPHVWRPEAASLVDLVPTILHLMSVNDPNPFEGQSLFDDRSHHDSVIAGQSDGALSVIFLDDLAPDGKRVIRAFGGCDPDEKSESWKLSSCEAFAWQKWQRGLLSENRVWPHRAASAH